MLSNTIIACTNNRVIICVRNVYEILYDCSCNNCSVIDRSCSSVPLEDPGSRPLKETAHVNQIWLVFREQEKRLHATTVQFDLGKYNGNC